MSRAFARMAGIVLVVLVSAQLVPHLAKADPPYAGTIFLERDIITDQDPTAFASLMPTGRGMRRMFDRRVNGWVDVNAFLYLATYDDGLTIEIQVNPEFGSVAARQQADFYAPVFGRLPRVLREKVKTSWIHKGDRPFGGDNNNLLVHTGATQDYILDGILEETLFHEAVHTSLDAQHATNPRWIAAQLSDAEFISNYARDNPAREDVAETFLTYLAQKYRSHRISPANLLNFRTVVPARNAYFDRLTMDLYPFEAKPPGNRDYHLSTLFRGANMRLDVFNGGEFNNMTHLAPAAAATGQFWRFTPRTDGWYQLTNRFRGNNVCLDVHNGGAFDNAPYLKGCAHVSGQFWKPVPAGRNRYRLVSQFRGDRVCLDIHNGGRFNNMPQLVPCADVSGQIWVLTPVP